MSELSIARRYAKSLLDLAIEQNKTEKIIEDVKTISSAMASRDLVLLLKSPIIKADRKVKALTSIFGGKVDELTMRFLELMTKKGREKILPEIAQAVNDQYNELKNITTATLTTAVKADASMINEIEKKLATSTGSVDINTEVDPSIIGGYVLRIGDKIYDASVQKQIKDLRKELTNG